MASNKVAPSRTLTPSLKGPVKRGCLPVSTVSVTGYGTKGPGGHFPEVAGQHEPTDANLPRQHHNMAVEGLGK